jgi:mannose-1-phosphate guanylyltransferase
VSPADHVIKNNSAFSESIRAAGDFIKKYPDYIVQLGEKPSFPDTGLGYIKRGEFLAEIADLEVYKVDFFKEKPNLKRTKAYVKEGNYFWNTAIYVLMPALLEKLAAQYVPDNYQRYLKIKRLLSKNGAESEIEAEYSQMDKASLEYSIIENYDKVAVIPTDMGWSDVGSWSVLKKVLSSPSGSYIKGNYIDIDCENVMVYGSFDKLVAGVGIKNLVIVVTDDIILVCNKDDSQKVKKVIEKLEKQKKFNYI